MIDRRAFVAGVGAEPFAAEAQRLGKLPRVGDLSTGSRSDPVFQSLVNAFRQGFATSATWRTKIS